MLLLGRSTTSSSRGPAAGAAGGPPRPAARRRHGRRGDLALRRDDRRARQGGLPGSGLRGARRSRPAPRPSPQPGPPAGPSGSRRRTSISRTSSPPRSATPASRSRRSSPSRASAGSWPILPPGWRTPSCAVVSCGRSRAWSPSPRCSARARTCSPSAAPERRPVPDPDQCGFAGSLPPNLPRPPPVVAAQVRLCGFMHDPCDICSGGRMSERGPSQRVHNALGRALPSDQFQGRCAPCS